MSELHGHGPGHHHHADSLRRTAARSLSRLWLCFALTAAFVVVEVVTAVLTGSLALLSDAGHMLTDAVAIALTLGAIVVANRARREGLRTFGLFRLEILASLCNAVLLFLVAAYVVVESVVRLVNGGEDVDAGPMLVVAVVGLVVNAVVFVLLREPGRGSLAIQSAALDALADAAGSVGVIVAAVVIATVGWDPVDPIVAVGIAAFVIPRAWRLAAQAVRVLLEVAPPHVDVRGIEVELRGLPGVTDVHDLHVWTLTSEMDVASAHVMIGPGTDAHSVLDQARVLLQRHEIAHATIQVEPDDHEGCSEINW